MMRRVARWVGFKADEVGANHPRTRAADRVPDMNFEGASKAPEPRHEPAKEPLTQSHDS